MTRLHGLPLIMPLIMPPIIICAFLTGCGEDAQTLQSLVDPQSNVAESATAAIGGIATDTEGGSLSATATTTASASSANSTSSVTALATCSYAAARGTCSSTAMAVTWPSCTMTTANSLSLTLTGGWTNTYDTAATCQSAQAGNALVSGQSLTRTATSFVLTVPIGASLTTDTTAHSNYLSQLIPGTGISAALTSSTTRSVVINGLHQVLRGSHGGIWFDHSLTSTPVTITGTRAAGTRAISSGSVTLYHNLMKFTAVSTFNSVAWKDATCCFPTSGKLSLAFTGAVSGNASMAYGPTCGNAQYTDTNGKVTAVSLTICE